MSVCEICNGARVLVNVDGEGLMPDPAWAGDVLPNLRGGTVVQIGEAVACSGCGGIVDMPDHPASFQGRGQEITRAIESMTTEATS